MNRITLAARLGCWATLAAITILSLLPVQFAVQSGLSDKIDHFAAYAALTLTGRIGYRNVLSPLALGAAILAYSIGIEFAQYFIPGRMMSALDVVANAAGLAIGLGLSWIILRYLSRRETTAGRKSNG